MAQFYSHLIEIESLIIKLDKLDLSDSQRLHLSQLIDSTLHHTVLDAILGELNEADKELFMRHLQLGDHQQIWDFLDKRVFNIEQRIIDAAEGLKDQIHQDIDEVVK